MYLQKRGENVSNEFHANINFQLSRVACVEEAQRGLEQAMITRGIACLALGGLAWTQLNRSIFWKGVLALDLGCVGWSGWSFKREHRIFEGASRIKIPLETLASKWYYWGNSMQSLKIYIEGEGPSATFKDWVAPFFENQRLSPSRWMAQICLLHAAERLKCGNKKEAQQGYDAAQPWMDTRILGQPESFLSEEIKEKLDELG